VLKFLPFYLWLQRWFHPGRQGAVQPAVTSSISGHGTAQEQVVREQSAICALSCYPYFSLHTFFIARLHFLSPLYFTIFFTSFFPISSCIFLLNFPYSSFFLTLSILSSTSFSSVFCVYHSSFSYNFSPLSLFWKYKNRLMRLPCCLCVCVSPLLTSECLNQSYETRYVYHGIWAHLNGVLHKCLPSVWVSVKCIHLPLVDNGSVTKLPR
jgi:hypothetical protein